MTEVLTVLPKLTAGIKFPANLWDMVNNCNSGAISWGCFGNCIKINKVMFEKEYLTSGEQLFSSFIRQLNVYGFRKVRNQLKYVRMPVEFSNDVMEYHHPLFVKGHPELLPYLRRKVRHPNRCDKQPQRKLVKDNNLDQDEVLSCENPDTDKCKKLQEKVAECHEDDSSFQNVTKTDMDEIFQVVSQSLSEEVASYVGGARISGPVFPSFNLSSPT